MRKSHIPLMLAAWLMTTVSVHAADQTIEDPETHITFPNEISIQQSGKTYQLKPTGVATRTKFIIKAYSVAHYMDQPPSGTPEAIFQEILTDNRAKEMRIQWNYAVDVTKLTDGYKESFHKMLSDEQYKALEPAINQYISFFTKNIAIKDQNIITWLPGGIVEVEINGEKKGTITNKDFAEALWSIWFGPKSVVNRNRLISFLVPQGK